MITFMVNKGFSLLELRKLYIDELSSYYESLIYVLEKKGEVKEGSYERITSKDTVAALRRQLGMFGIHHHTLVFLLNGDMELNRNR